MKALTHSGLALLCVALSGFAADEPKPANTTTAPQALPGNGLAQHDFLYAGEA